MTVSLFYSIIQSFESITTNLVDQQNFTNLTVIERDVTMEARRVRKSLIKNFLAQFVYFLLGFKNWFPYGANGVNTKATKW